MKLQETQHGRSQLARPNQSAWPDRRENNHDAVPVNEACRPSLRPSYAHDPFPVTAPPRVGGAARARAIVAGAAVCLGLLASSSARADLTLINTWPGFVRGQAVDVAVSGTRAYLAMGYQGLTILDISRPAQPTAVRQIPFSYNPGSGMRTDYVLWVESYGDWIFVGTSGKGVHILDAHGPGYGEVGLIPASEVAPWVKGRFEGRYGYFEGGGAISIYDLTQPARPLRVGQAAMPAAVTDLCVQDGIVYAVRYASVFRVDVRDPAHPTGLTVQRLAVEPADGNRILSDGAFVYFSAFRSKKVLVLDAGLLEAGQPAVVAGALTVGLPNAIAVGPNCLVVGEYGYGLRIYEKPAPGLINYVDRPVATIPMAGGPFHLQIVGDTAVVVDEQSQPNQATAPDAGSPASLQVFNLTDPAHPTRTGAFPTYGTANQLEVWGDYAFLADGPSGVTVLDAHDPDHPSYVASLPVKSAANSVVVRDGLAYVVSSTSVGLRWFLMCDIFDVHDPANASLLSHYEFVAHDNYALYVHRGALRLDGSRLFVNWGDSNGSVAYVHLLDVADPRNPRVLAQISLGSGSTEDMAVAQGHLIVSLYRGDYGKSLRVYNLDDPAAPRLVGTAPISSAGGLLAQGNILYCGYNTGFSVYDMTTPAAPQLLASRDHGGGGPDSFDIDGRYLYVAGGRAVDVFDVADPSRPVLLTSYRSPLDDEKTVRVINGRLLVLERMASSDDTGELYTLAGLPGQVAPEITQQPQGQGVAQGKPVTFTVIAQGSGTLRYQWRKDGQDIAGATAPSLTIAAATAADAGRYTVVVRNAAGDTPSQEAFLTVIVPPSISVQPVGGSALLGGHVEFKVAAAGQDLRYQWRRNGQDIPGATDATLRIDAATAAAGAYTVVVRNAAGSVESAVADFAAVRLQMLASIVLEGRIGSVWRLEFTTDVAEPMHWQLATTVTLTSSPQVWVDADSAGQPKRFYRAVPGP